MNFVDVVILEKIYDQLLIRNVVIDLRGHCVVQLMKDICE